MSNDYTDGYGAGYDAGYGAGRKVADEELAAILAEVEKLCLQFAPHRRRAAMIKPEQVPDAAIQAMMQSEEWTSFFSRSDAKKLVATCLNAWPGITMKQSNEHVALFHSDPAIILPPATGKYQ